jgi:hypothetical protein
LFLCQLVQLRLELIQRGELPAFHTVPNLVHDLLHARWTGHTGLFVKTTFFIFFAASAWTGIIPVDFHGDTISFSMWGNA